MSSNEEKQKPDISATVHDGCSTCRMQRRDMFRCIRWHLWFSAMYRLPLERYFPARLRFLAVTLDWTYELFLYSTLLHIDILFICTIYLNQDKGDLELLVNCIIQTVIYTWAIVAKVFFKRIQPKRVKELMRYLNEECRTRSAAGFTYVTFKESVDMSNMWTTVFLICCYAGVTFWLFVPIFNQDRSLPLACWYPIDFKVPIVYEFIYFLQTVGQLQIAAAFGCTSAFYVLIAVIFSGQFDILNCSLKNILATTYIILRKPKSELILLREEQSIADYELNQYYIAKEYSNDCDCIPHFFDKETPKPENFYEGFKIALRPCIAHHRYILYGLKMLEDLYSNLSFLKYLEVTLLVCLVAFVWVKSTAANSFLRLLSLSQYLLLALWEMFMICYMGEIIFLCSKRCDEAIQRSPWHLHSGEIKQDTLFFILNAQRPFRLTGGKMYNLNLKMFRTILTTSFSILTILQNMDLRQPQPK
ncbi:odorant receptor 83a [Bactrocera dorsalis]|uniref:Odorant receptor n=1 Tax=Bactrocera dorsalis TaxID=27457 RepID=A0A6I9VJU7_BACDO|nr:odorant receptor 83a [Bactrocera dorsalis]